MNTQNAEGVDRHYSPPSYAVVASKPAATKPCGQKEKWCTRIMPAMLALTSVAMAKALTPASARRTVPAPVLKCRNVSDPADGMKAVVLWPTLLHASKKHAVAAKFLIAHKHRLNYSSNCAPQSLGGHSKGFGWRPARQSKASQHVFHV